MKKLLVSIIVLVLVMTCALTLLSACGSTVDYEHTIVFYTSQGDDLSKVTLNAIASFEAKYPGWKVVHTQCGGYDDVKSKVISDFQGQIQPDLAYCYADHVAQYLQTSKVVNLNKYINSTVSVTGKNVVADEDGVRSGDKDVDYAVGYTAAEVADFVEGYYKEGLASNYSSYADYGYSAEDMLTLPFVKSTELLYYNKTALDACGLSVATTWEEMWAQCETIKKKYPTCTPVGYDSEANWFITMCEQNGWGYTSADEAEHYLFNSNNDSLKSWLGKLNEYWEKGWLTTQNDYGSYTSALFTKGADDGGLVYCIGSSGGASHQKTSNFTWGIAPVPGSASGVEGKKNAAISQGPSLVMLTGGHNVTNVEEKETMTFLFVKELLDPTFQAAFSVKAGYNPCRKSTLQLDAYQEFLADKNDITAVAANIASQMTAVFFTSPAFVGSSTARTQVGNALLYVMQGEKDAGKALRDAYINCGGKN